MKLLVVSNYYPEHVGGIEFVAMNMVARLRRDHVVRWIACDVRSRPHHSHVDDIPLPSSNFTEERLGFPYPIPLGFSITKIYEQVKWCDVVHIHDFLYISNIVAYLASRWYRKPILVTQHVAAIPYKEAYKNLLQFLAIHSIGRIVLKSAEQVVFISVRVQRWFEAKMSLAKRHLLIQNGVDARLFYPAAPGERNAIRSHFGISPTEPVLLFVGRMTAKKGFHLIRELAQARSDVTWWMIGGGELDPRTWGLSNVRVFPLQAQEDLRRFYISADALILPSTGEGFPLVVQEAMSCGLPVAVSQEIADYEPDAPLIHLEISSSPSQLAQWLSVLLADQDRLRALGEASSAFASRWDWESVVKRYEALYSALSPS